MESDELLLSFFNAIIPKMKIDPALVEDITIGNCIGELPFFTGTLNQDEQCNKLTISFRIAPGAAYIGRAAALTAGFPEATACQIINRFCSSGLMAVSIIANNIRNGEIECGLAVGFESMSAT